MKDEEFVYREDVRDKANVARSAHHKRSHTGKGGRVKFPSDYMTKKEKEAMNGEVKSYRLNEPMTWKAFKAMPDDIKVMYIMALREKFNVLDGKIAEMLCVHKGSFSYEMKRLGLNVGQRDGRTWKWDSEGWYAWCGGVKMEKAEEPVIETPVADEAKQVEDKTPVVEAPVEEIEVPKVERVKAFFFDEVKNLAIPSNGTMTFEGKVEEILKSIGNLLGGANVHISVTWDVLEDD